MSLLGGGLLTVLAGHLPLSFQRSLAFVPFIQIDPVVQAPASFGPESMTVNSLHFNLCAIQVNAIPLPDFNGPETKFLSTVIQYILGSFQCNHG